VNNAVENDFFGFPKVNWLVATVYSEVGKCTSYWCQISSGFNAPKIIKISQFLTELFEKIKRWTFLSHSVYKRSHKRCRSWPVRPIGKERKGRVFI